MKKAAWFLVRYRWTLLIVTVGVAIGSLLLIPRVNINTDLTRYLPEDSPMKQGMDRMREDFPGIDTRMRALDVMFTVPVDVEEMRAELAPFTEGLTDMGVRESPPYTLFQYRISGSGDPLVLKEAVQQHFGERVVVEISGEEKMPPDIVFILVLGVSLAFVILVIMCASLMEVVLFLVTMGLAVLINMGTNALLDSVSMITSTLVAVLQLVLSMDFAIIVANRYRQEKALCPDRESAMAAALSGAMPSVLSSALTTIVSLLMLVFMRFKIGTDIGVVLSKGVFSSLLCTFTVLPALALLCDKAIDATQKKVPALPAKALARFEMRFRIPLALLFVALFVGSFLLQKRTVISFSAFWPTEITSEFPPQNPMMLLYDTADEAAVPSMMDTLETDPMVASAVSYPGMVLRKYTAEEMAQRYASLSPMMSDELLQMVYYARSHPDRTERFSLGELQDYAAELADRGLVPEGFDVASLTRRFQAMADAPEEVPEAESVVEPEPEPAPEVPAEPEQEAEPPAADTLEQPLPPVTDTTVASVDSLPKQQPAGMTYEEATRQRTPREMARHTGISRTQTAMLYRLAGRMGKGASGTMSLHEMVRFAVKEVLPDKRYAAFISKEQKEELQWHLHALDSVVAAGPLMPMEEVPVPSAPEEVVPAEDSLQAVSVPVEVVESVPDSVPEPEPEIEPEPEPTPLEWLAEMAFSGERSTAARTGRALRAAGIPVSQQDMDLMYLYAASRRDADPEARMSVSELVTYLADTLLVDPAFSRFVDDDSRKQLLEAKELLVGSVDALRSDRSSIAALITDYPRESPETFAFIDSLQAMGDRDLTANHYLVGESVMFRELKECFPSELLLLTLLTIASIFLIVAFTFRSLLIPVFLVITVLTGVYFNVFASGWGGNTMFFLAYLIVQSILMGAIIDYSILITHYYLESRKTHDVPEALVEAYRGSGHSIMTSGLIIVLTPLLMYITLNDPMIAMILKSLSIGAFAAILIILLVLPGMLAFCDRLIKK